ncbi:unnamed protein product, partial [Mesorhabditis belari]|uniref:Uncharacterized protein n=1 Tax=Mesorhabditis belari TaxID=2138241 RepID=A0AAF3FS82_9BILA
MVTAWLALSINIITSIVIIIADLILLCRFCIRHREYKMYSMQKQFQASRDSATYARTPALAIYLIGRQLGMSDEEILAEYEKDWGERKLIVESILGKEDEDELCRFFLRNYMSRFMQYGYAEEALMISALRQKAIDEQQMMASIGMK